MSIESISGQSNASTGSKGIEEMNNNFLAGLLDHT